MGANGKNQGYLLSVLLNKCPRCREGNLYKSNNPYSFKNSAYIEMNECCPVCGQPTDIEVGFYYGTSFVSYALAVIISAATFILWWVLIGFSIDADDNRIFWWLGINAALLIILLPVLMRLSRSLWLSWFVKYDSEWAQHSVPNHERIVKEQMNNW